MKSIVSRGTFVLLLLCFTACGPAAKLRRAQRLEAEAIAQGAKVKTDTVYVDRIVPGKEIKVEVPVEKIVRYDSIAYIKGEATKIPVYRTIPLDTTLMVGKSRVDIKWKNKKLNITVETPPDTLKVPVTVHKSIICPEQDHTWRTVAWSLIGALVLIVIFVIKR